MLNTGGDDGGPPTIDTGGDMKNQNILSAKSTKSYIYLNIGFDRLGESAVDPGDGSGTPPLARVFACINIAARTILMICLY